MCMEEDTSRMSCFMATSSSSPSASNRLRKSSTVLMVDDASNIYGLKDVGAMELAGVEEVGDGAAEGEKKKQETEHGERASWFRFGGVG